MAQAGLVVGVKIENANDFFCEPCQLDQPHRLPFRVNQDKRSSRPGEFIHTDVCGKMQVESLDRPEYYVMFIDDASSFCYVYFLKHKDKVLEKCKLFVAIVVNRFGQHIKTVLSDNSGEYTNIKMSQYLEERGIVMEISHHVLRSKTARRRGRTGRSSKVCERC